jgi:hypothetical protein
MADFRAGLLPARKAASISAHLSACPRCAELDAQLAAVTSLLAATPTPPMPAGLVARLDAVLAAEAAARAAGTDAAVAGSAPPAPSSTAPPVTAPPATAPPATAPPATAPPATAPPAPGGGAIPQPAGRSAPPRISRRPGHRRPAGARPAGRGPGRGGTRPPSWLALRLATAAAAIVLVAGGGYAIAQLVSSGTPATTAGPALSAPHSMSGQSSAHRSVASGFVPAAGPAARLQLPVVHSGTRYRAGLLPAQVRLVLRRFTAPAPSPSAAHVPRPAAAPAAFPQLATCVSRVAGAAVPRLIDIASYHGHPVAVIVVPVPGSSTVRVWLVGTACPAHGGDVITYFSMPGTG